MNATQAKAAMRKLLGPKAMWRYDEHAPSAEERESVRAKLPALSESRHDAKARLEARRAELLADPLYRQLVADYHTASKTHDNALALVRRRRVTVGRDGGLFFAVVAEGDNWQDAIDKTRAALAKVGT